MNYLVSLVETCGLNALLALSVYATFAVGQFSLAQVGFWAIGAYTTGTLTALYGLGLFPSLIASAALATVIGAVLGYPCLRIRGIYLALATVAFAEVVRVFFHNFVWQAEIGGKMTGPGGPLGFRGIPVLTAWPQILAAVLAVSLLFAWIERTRIGLSLKAAREDELAAACAGVRVVVLKVAMFALGAAIASVGGGLYATYLSYVDADYFGFHLALISIFYVAVGGSQSVLGPIAGAVLLTILPEALRFSGNLHMVAYGLVVLAVTVLFPRGLSAISLRRTA